jgi:tRNA A-37 threonylcarbamoyl transferase component Bud32
VLSARQARHIDSRDDGAAHSVEAARRLLLSYIPGERLLEWVLRRYGDQGLDLAEFASLHGIRTNDRVQRAFERFRAASDPEATALRNAIVDTYRRLHRTSFLHGDPGPRNIIYDGERAHLIDFDHTRPSLAPARVDSRALQRWYGVDLKPSRHADAALRPRAAEAERPAR